MNRDQSKIYTCPMHPEIRRNYPGRCSKCGMNLVQSEQLKAQKGKQNQMPLKSSFYDYLPLIVIILMITAVSAVISWNNYRAAGSFEISGFLLNFMTGFFLVFGSFKLMDIKGFAEGYYTYDLLAKKWYGYGYIYPFIELAFGFLMLTGYHPDWLLWTEFGLMAFSGFGVALKLARGEKFQCACLGTFLKVPLTKVTLIEDFGMTALALVLILL